MKKTLLTAVALPILTVFSTRAQITVDSTDYGSIGDTVYLALDSMPQGISAGPSGFQTWDFSSLMVEFYDTLAFIAPTDPNFPASNLAVKGEYATPYYIKTVNDLSLDGVYMSSVFGFPINFTANYEDNQEVMTFPSTYLDIFSGTAKMDTVFRDPQFATYVDSAKLIRTVYINSTIDGYGTVITPSESPAVIRQYRVEVNIDTLCFKGGIFGPSWTCPMPIIPIVNMPNPIIDTSYIYSWWAKGMKYPVVELRTDKTGDTVRVANFIIGNKVTAIPGNVIQPACNGSCDGQAVVGTLGGVAPMTFMWDASAMNQTTQIATGLCAGNYSVTVIDAANDSSLTNITIGEPQALAITVNSKIDSTNCDTCLSGSITVTASGGTPPYSFTWSNGLTGGSVTGLAEGAYTVTVTDANGCIGSLSSIIIDLIGINENIIDKNNVIFFPNPAGSSVTFINGSTTETSIEISDYTGRIVSTTFIGRGKVRLSVEHLSAGLYLVRALNRDGAVINTVRLAIIK